MQDEAAKINNEEYINNLEKYNINTIIDLKNLFRTITNIGLDLEKTKKLCDDEFGIEKISNLEELYDNQLKEKFDITTFKPERGDKFDETMSIELSEDMSVKDDRFDKKTVVYSFQKGYLFNPLLHQGNNSKGDVLSEATVALYNQNN
jgi:molecular chaperone GrpE (heat shock protein)